MSWFLWTRFAHAFLVDILIFHMHPVAYWQRGFSTECTWCDVTFYLACSIGDCALYYYIMVTPKITHPWSPLHLCVISVLILRNKIPPCSCVQGAMACDWFSSWSPINGMTTPMALILPAGCPVFLPFANNMGEMPVFCQSFYIYIRCISERMYTHSP